MHVYEVRTRKDHRGVDLISDVLPFRRLWYGEPNAVSNAIDYAKFRSRLDDALSRSLWNASFVKPNERATYRDPDTGATVIQWTNAPCTNQHLYFTSFSVTQDDRWLVILSRRDGHT